MIRKLQLQNFKCFQQKTTFEFAKLNLLTGVNGRGKSSLLQALLILSQSALKNEDMKELIINGEFIDFGNFDDIKNSETSRKKNINFKFNMVPSIDIELQYKENLNDAFSAKCVNFKTTPQGKKADFIQLIKFIHYVSADRHGPLKYVDKLSLPKFIHVGTRGEYTINILANDINLPNVNDVMCRGDNAHSICQQTEEWLGYILDGAKIAIKGKDKESGVLYMLLDNKKNSPLYKPINVGFGYSYILPLIVTGLIAKKGETIIIENPEAHLHPKAQSRIAEFFARVASYGVQVFIESHSEHILNGIRRACLSPSKRGFSYNDVNVYFFDGYKKSTDIKPRLIKIMKDGDLSDFPIDFFDQTRQDLLEIINKINMQ
jgi:predicted ATPase